MSKELDSLKNINIDKENKLNEMKIDLDNLKKEKDNFLKFKAEKENLILENAKLESKLMSIQTDLEDKSSFTERQGIILKNKEEQILKLNDEITYINFNAKKIKSDYDKSYKDVVNYQIILRKLEKELLETKTGKDKIENELNIIKQQLFNINNSSLRIK